MREEGRNMTDCVRDAGWTIPVLYEDNHLLCVEKPANLPVQADSSLDRDLLSILRDYIGRRYEKPGRVYLGLVHRLDRPVGGAMLFARTSKAAARLSAQFAAHTVQKRYYAVLQGELRAETRLENLLVSDERTGMTREARPGEAGAKKAALVSTPLLVRDGLTLADVRLETGRRHQIRVQHLLAGLPLWGDARYGGGRPGQQIALWAHSLTFEHPTLKTPVAIESLPPPEGAWRKFPEYASKNSPEYAKERFDV